MAMVAAGSFCPAGLFVPTLVSGASIGRLLGLLLNSIASDAVADCGTYALMGAAAVLGGMSRMTISGVVIMLEASGNNEYLLPLMLVFAAARYTGNIFNQSMYDMQIEKKNLPFLEAHLKHIGLLNYHPVSEIMCKNVKTLREVMKVADVEWLLKNTAHQGFPVISRQGHVKGFMLRKHLCTLINLRQFSFISSGADERAQESIDTDISERQSFSNSVLEEHLDSGLEGHADRPSFQDIESGVGIESGAGARAGDEPTNSLRLPDLSEGEEKISDVEENNSSQSRLKTISLCASPALAFEAIEKGSYPKEPSISDIKLTSAERDAWLDLRMYLDRAPYILLDKSSIQKAYRYFRTLGLRHLMCVDHKNRLTGILTRKDLTEQRLESFWLFEEDHVGNFQRIDGDAKPIEDFIMVETGHLLPISRYTDADDVSISHGSFRKGSSIFGRDAAAPATFPI